MLLIGEWFGANLALGEEEGSEIGLTLRDATMTQYEAYEIDTCPRGFLPNAWARKDVFT